MKNNSESGSFRRRRKSDAPAGKILAIDFGGRNIGLAVSDAGRQIVFGKGTIRGFKNLDQVFVRIRDLCIEEQVKVIVFGVPVDEEGEETVRSRRYRVIAQKLEAFLKDIPVFFEDEAYSTVEAEHRDFGLEEEHLVAFRTKLSDHERAAMLILRRFLGEAS